MAQWGEAVESRTNNDVSPDPPTALRLNVLAQRDSDRPSKPESHSPDSLVYFFLQYDRIYGSKGKGGGSEDDGVEDEGEVGDVGADDEVHIFGGSGVGVVTDKAMVRTHTHALSRHVTRHVCIATLRTC